MFLFALLKEHLDSQKLMTFLTNFGVEDTTVKQYLKGLQ